MSELIVYLAGERTGRLIRKENGNLQFRYDPDYVGPRISHALPVQAEAHPHDVCRAVFGGLLLEGESRKALAQRFGISVGNDYGLIEELGGDVAGALTILPPEAEIPAQPEVRALSADDLDATIRELPERPLAADPEAGTRLSLAGAQPKLPVIIDRGQLALPLNSAAPTTHIIKPEPARFPGLVDNEMFCIELGRAVGLLTASASRQKTSSGVSCLLVERYDRDPTTDPIRRLHQEDMCQALGVASDRKYQAEGGPGVVDVMRLLRRASAVPAQELPRFWKAVSFNWLIGNCDAHGKNYSLLYDAAAPTLAPLYDLVSTTVYGGLTRRLAMSIAGAKLVDDVTLKSFEKLARAAGLNRQFGKSALFEVVEAASAAADELASDRRHQNDVVQEIVKGIRARAVELLG